MMKFNSTQTLPNENEKVLLDIKLCEDDVFHATMKLLISDDDNIMCDSSDN